MENKKEIKDKEYEDDKENDCGELPGALWAL